MDFRPQLSQAAILLTLGAFLAGCLVVGKRETGEMQLLDQPRSGAGGGRNEATRQRWWPHGGLPVVLKV
jgi:hypothetical protein